MKILIFPLVERLNKKNRSLFDKSTKLGTINICLFHIKYCSIKITMLKEPEKENQWKIY